MEALQTEEQYDAVTVWDGQGVVAVLSGTPAAGPTAVTPVLPGEKSVTITTDTGYFLVGVVVVVGSLCRDLEEARREPGCSVR